MAKKDTKNTMQAGPATESVAMTPPVQPESTALEVYDWGDDAGGGNENRQKKDNLIPVYRVLQGLSPQVQDKTRAVRAEAGDWYNTATDTTIPADVEIDAPGLIFQPVFYKTVINEWVPKEKFGGGFVASYEPTDERIAELVAANPFGKIKIEQGGISGDQKTPTELVETKTMFGFRLDPDTLEQVEPIVLHFESTKIKPWKAWLNRISPASADPKKVPPLWANMVRIRTKLEKRDAGNSFNVVFDPIMNGDKPSLIGPQDPRYINAKRFRADVMENKVKADDEADRKTGGPDAANPDGSPF